MSRATSTLARRALGPEGERGRRQRPVDAVGEVVRRRAPHPRVDAGRRGLSRLPRPIRPENADGATSSGIGVVIASASVRPASSARQARSARRYRLRPIGAPATTTILQLSDLHRFADADARLFGVPTGVLLEEVLADVWESGLRPDHVVVTGDLAHDDRGETYAAVRELLEPVLDRLWLLPGNHDDRAAMRAAFGDRIAGLGGDRINFAFTAGDWLCLGVDTQLAGAVAGRLGADQVGWIRGQLATTTLAQPCSSCTTRRSSSASSGWIGSGSRTRACSWTCSRRSRGSGSSAAATSTTRRRRGSRRPRSCTVPSTGLQFSPTSDDAEFVEAPPGYRVVELSADGYATSVVRVPASSYAPTQP